MNTNDNFQTFNIDSYHSTTTQSSPYAYEDSILSALGKLLNFYTEQHGKVLAVRFDLHYPLQNDLTVINQDISRCMAKIVQKYKRQGLDPYYIWAREQENSHNPHYHCLILLNGNRVKSYAHVFQTAETLWGNTLGVPAAGLVHHCTQGKNGISHENGIMLRRCDNNYQERCSEVLRQTSYLAKTDGKAGYNDGLRDFGMSRIPK